MDKSLDWKWPSVHLFDDKVTHIGGCLIDGQVKKGHGLMRAKLVVMSGIYAEVYYCLPKTVREIVKPGNQSWCPDIGFSFRDGEYLGRGVTTSNPDRENHLILFGIQRMMEGTIGGGSSVYDVLEYLDSMK